MKTIKRFSTLDKLWRTVIGWVFVAHPVIFWRAFKVFLYEVREEYGIAYANWRTMMKQKPEKPKEVKKDDEHV